MPRKTYNAACSHPIEGAGERGRRAAPPKRGTGCQRWTPPRRRADGEKGGGGGGGRNLPFLARLVAGHGAGLACSPLKLRAGRRPTIIMLAAAVGRACGAASERRRRPIEGREAALPATPRRRPPYNSTWTARRSGRQLVEGRRTTYACQLCILSYLISYYLS